MEQVPGQSPSSTFAAQYNYIGQLDSLFGTNASPISTSRRRPLGPRGAGAGRQDGLRLHEGHRHSSTVARFTQVIPARLHRRRRLHRKRRHQRRPVQESATPAPTISRSASTSNLRGEATYGKDYTTNMNIPCPSSAPAWRRRGRSRSAASVTSLSSRHPDYAYIEHPAGVSQIHRARQRHRRQHLRVPRAGRLHSPRIDRTTSVRSNRTRRSWTSSTTTTRTSTSRRRPQRPAAGRRTRRTLANPFGDRARA